MEASRPLAGCNVLITGAGSGIGQATARLASVAGAYVIATDVKGHDETVASIVEEGGSAEAHALDVTDLSAWQSLVDDLVAGGRSIHGLANVAGIVSGSDTITTQTEAGFDRILAVDLKGPFFGMKVVLSHMLESGGGKIVNVASVAAVIGMPNVVAYSAAKGGLIGMSRQVAVEHARRNVQVNVIAPGLTATSMLGDINEKLLAAAKAVTPAGRVGDPTDPAGLIVYLLGAGSDFITGQVFNVDGGWTAQ